MQDYLIRPVKEADYPKVLEIAHQTGPGFNSLPNNAVVIENKIQLSINSFSGKIEAQKRFYLFVMESLKSQEIVGTAGIKTSAGTPYPFYKFKLLNLALYSSTLNQLRNYRTLHWVNDHECATELEALYLLPSHRRGGLGALMSRSRLLFIAEFLDLFSEVIIADLRGVSDEKGISPFWEAVGKKFFGISYEEASYLKAVEGPKFVTELMPQYPIYIDLLPLEAQRAVGITHQNSIPAFMMLKKEGLQFKNYIDVFDAGPLVEAAKTETKTIKESKKARVVALKPIREPLELKLISNTEINFRATLGKLELTEGGDAIIEENLARILSISANDYIRFSTFKHG